ncbi:C40 family peptidase [Desulfosarcina sp.]|uniref:C40 family peptidase n=1 Tax=Desulfosarcina sp. TaxID=2027861 RepID=UPI003970934A
MAADSAIHNGVYRSTNNWCTGCLTLVVISLLTAGCVTTTVPDAEPERSVVAGGQTDQMLRAEIRFWLGTPHRMGGMSPRGIDCSGLVVVVFADLFDIRLPRTTTELMRTGRRVEKNNLTAGDLVFFRPDHKTHHVGIYLDRGEFVHASTRHGVIISRMDDDFWHRCYLTSRRFL